MNQKRLKNIQRYKIDHFSRLKKIRLDKNEITSVKDFFTSKFKKKLKIDIFNSYPEMGQIYKKISNIHKINEQQILLTSGIDIGIRHCFELFLNQGQTVMTLEPTYAMIDVYCGIFGVKKIQIKYDKNLNLNYEKILKQINNKIKLIIIANPNSPTGTVISKQNLIRILNKSRKLKIPVLIDEAYYGFCTITAIPLLKKFKNLIIARTFSKAYGMAGLRAGYLISNYNYSKNFYKIKPMYEINSMAVLAIKILLDNPGIRKHHIKEARYGESKLKSFANKNKLFYKKTFANFFLLKINKNKEKLISHLKRKNILIKSFSKKSILKDYVRISLAPQSKIISFIREVKKSNLFI